MHLTQDTYSLTDFKQNAQEHLERLRESGRPEVLTVNGKAEAVVMTPEVYDSIIQGALEDVKRKLAIGLAQARAGDVVDGEESFARRRAERARTGKPA